MRGYWWRGKGCNTLTLQNAPFQNAGHGWPALRYLNSPGQGEDPAGASCISCPGPFAPAPHSQPPTFRTHVVRKEAQQAPHVSHPPVLLSSPPLTTHFLATIPSSPPRSPQPFSPTHVHQNTPGQGTGPAGTSRLFLSDHARPPPKSFRPYHHRHSRTHLIGGQAQQAPHIRFSTPFPSTLVHAPPLPPPTPSEHTWSGGRPSRRCTSFSNLTLVCF